MIRVRIVRVVISWGWGLCIFCVNGMLLFSKPWLCVMNNNNDQRRMDYAH